MELSILYFKGLLDRISIKRSISDIIVFILTNSADLMKYQFEGIQNEKR